VRNLLGEEEAGALYDALFDHPAAELAKRPDWNGRFTSIASALANTLRISRWNRAFPFAK
jgi:hypothetical protein